MRVLTNWSGFDGFPVWSPDGRWIAFASDRDATQAQIEANATSGVDTGFSPRRRTPSRLVKRDAERINGEDLGGTSQGAL